MADEKDGEPNTPDLRQTSHEQRSVRVERDLSGGGHLARGDKTNMSRLNFSARAKPRDPGERDPTFVERDAKSAGATSKPVVPAPPAAPDTPVVAADHTAVEKPAEGGDGLLGKIGKMFGL